MEHLLKSWPLKKDTLEQYTVNIPIVDKKSVLVGYIAVEILNNEATKKPVFYSYLKNYINNTSVFNKYIIGNVFNGFGSKNVVLPLGFKKLQEYYTKLSDDAGTKNKENFKIAVQDFIVKPINSKLKTLDDNPEPTCDVTLAIRYIYQGVNGTSGSESQSTINAMLVNRVQNIYFAGTNVHVGLTYEGVTISGPTSIVGYFNAQNVVTELERIPGVEGVTNVQVTSSCQMGPTNPGNPGGGGGGYGSIEDATASTEYEIPDFNSNQINLSAYLNCFGLVRDDANTSYELTVYVVEPNNGTGAIKYGLDVGHTFVGIKKSNGTTSITQVFGFYPANKSIYDTPSKINDNGGTKYSVSETYILNRSQFDAVLGTAANIPDKQYNVVENNCTNAAFDICNNANLAIPENRVSFPMFMGSGYSPGTLGKDLRNQASTNNKINVGGGTAPMSHGPCN